MLDSAWLFSLLEERQARLAFLSKSEQSSEKRTGFSAWSYSNGNGHTDHEIKQVLCKLM